MNFRWLSIAPILSVAFAAAAACSSPAIPNQDAGAADDDYLLGGDTTVFDVSPLAFSLPARNLTSDHRDTFALGDHFFNRNWVTAPASTIDTDGLGPTYNATSCSACHFKDGRGAPPDKPDEPFIALLVRLSIPGTDEHGGPVGEPSYGGQLNPFGVLGVLGEGKPVVTYEEVTGAFADGETYSLRKPTYRIDGLAFGPFATTTMFSPRVAPAMIGLGLIEAIPETSIASFADINDGNGDGISGKPNSVWSVREQKRVLGRFGWKANQPSLEQQGAGAFLGDIGITTDLFPSGECTPVQIACLAAPSGGAPELEAKKVAWITHYSAALAVPARRNATDETVRKGKALFTDAGCANCHRGGYLTGPHAIAELSGQRVYPYSDLLLHDMGDGLADGRPDFDADGREWRTTPLWGLGLYKTVSGHTFLLHDGRARNSSEAILWHGGEAEKSKQRYVAMPPLDRAALLAFLASL